VNEALRWNRMISPARTAWDDRKGETHCCAPEDKAEAVKLERRGLVTIRRTDDKFAGYTEWWVKLTPKGVAETEPTREQQGAA
jgi:hypothetical protein